jgi:hypothetical protein
VLAEVVDSQGRGARCHRQGQLPGFQVAGAGDLIDVGNGNPHNVDSFSRPRHYTWARSGARYPAAREVARWADAHRLGGRAAAGQADARGQARPRLAKGRTKTAMKCSHRPWLFLVAGLLDDLRPVMKMPKPLPRSSNRRATISEYKRRAQNYGKRT